MGLIEINLTKCNYIHDEIPLNVVETVAACVCAAYIINYTIDVSPKTEMEDSMFAFNFNGCQKRKAAISAAAWITEEATPIPG